MKPKLNEEIWTIYDEQILLETVEFIGEHSFLIEGYECKIDPRYWYEDYNITWWRSFDKAVKEMRRRYGRGIKLREVRHGWWRIEEE